jgi:hypothetical protein
MTLAKPLSLGKFPELGETDNAVFVAYIDSLVATGETISRP